ncbi:MAG: YicC family protein [Bacteroidetes bacterium]|nr:YicC family protein [Bacteroidota bacterium]
MKSMTGYGNSEYQDELFRVSVEIKSYNNRYLDIHINAPSYLSVFEQELKNLIKTEVTRGHVDVNIRIKQLESNLDIVVDKQVVAKLQAAFKTIAEIAGLDENPGLNHYLSNEDAIKLVKNIDAEIYHKTVIEQVKNALEPYCQTRELEGQTTYEDIIRNINTLEQSYTIVCGQADVLETKLHDNLTERFQKLLGEGYDEGRILQEVAVMLNKYTVNEEIQRIKSHLNQFKVVMDQETGVGKKLDFICQELNREINTTASKSIIAEINQAVVSMKDSLENIREQLRNIE